jgi:predicted molibdopterin-dependent oxidoreductase YjgC
LKKFQASWELSPRDSATSDAATDQAGLTAVEMIQAAESGRIRALYILGEDPAMTDPDSNHTRACLEACKFVVLQEILPSETAVYADIMLPGASFAEKDGTFTNTERRVQLVRKAIPSPGEARSDWQIIAEIARRVLELEKRQPKGPAAGWEYNHPTEILAEVAALTPSYAGISHSRLEQGDRLQWPVPNSAHAGTPILFQDGFPRGKGRFHAVEYLPAAELPDHEFPLLLTTGRVLYHWHGGELTRRVPELMELYAENLLEISPTDAARRGIVNEMSIRVRSRRGEMLAVAIITDRVANGVVFGTFHFPGIRNVNNLTIAALDPVAKIPEYKVCAVAVEPTSTRIE